MLGDKINLMFWEAPDEHYYVSVGFNGIVEVNYFDEKSMIKGQLTFGKDSDMEFIYHVLTRLGFKEVDK